MTTTVMFTAIPTGIVSANAATGATVASLSVYVTPQITDPTPLSPTSPLANWPRVAAGLSFRVQFVSNSATDPSAIATLDPNPAYAANRFDQALWQAIFLPNQPVSPWSPQSTNMTRSGLLSYGSKNVSAAVKATYHAAAQLPAHPIVSTQDLGEISRRVRDIGGAVRYGADVGNRVKHNLAAPGPSLSSAALAQVQSSKQIQTSFAETPDFIRAAAFHNMGNYRNLAATPTPPITSPDFHQLLGHLSDHPVLLRRLGLVIDLLFTIPGKLDGPTSLFVTTTAPIDPIQVTHPWTESVLHVAGGAHPPTCRPLYGDVEGATTSPIPFIDTNGQVRVDNESAAFIDDLDIDHAATLLADASSKIVDDLAVVPSVTMTLPALRTTGFALHQADREGKLGMRFQDTASWNPNGTSFVAENLVRGYRVDVRAAGATAWSSLCHRSTTISFTNGHPTVAVPAPDEGIVRAAPATTSNGDPIYNVGESLFHWDGWSLVASRPGLAVGPVTAANGTTTDGPVAPTNDGSGMNMPFVTKITARPGTLPRLRFGTSYQFRIRAVDLCGNDMGIAAGANAIDRVSPLKRFTRYEPVSPPVLQLRRPLTEGENVERLVIRSDPYASPPVYADAWAANNNIAPPGAPTGAPATMGMNPYYPSCERHVAPPKTSVHLAEYHGAVDVAVAAVPPGQARANAAWVVVSKEDGTFSDRLVTDTTTGQYRSYAQPGRSIVTPPSAAPLVANALASGQPAFTGNEDITPRGTALQSGQYIVFDADSLMLPYLPDPNANGLAIQGLGAAPVFRSYVARATNASGGAWPELATFRLVLNESRGALAWSGLSAQPSGGAGPATISLPPATVLVLPYSSTLADPTLHAFGPTTSSSPNFTSAQRGALPSLTPTRSLTLVHAVQRPKAPLLRGGDVVVLPRNEGDTVQPLQINVQFDAPSTGRVDLVASWVEYVDAPSSANPGQDPSTSPVSHTGAIASFTPNAGDTSSLQAVRQMFGDTKRRDVTYSAVATTRFREYFPASITKDATRITARATAAAALVCPSSARPPTPRVLYAVPAFSFRATTSGVTTTRTRAGGTIRVYCDRGWFASGADERLGLVLATSAKPTTPSLVSVWGSDPIWGRSPLGALDVNHLDPASFVSVTNGVPLAEGMGTVNVVTYRPTFNPERGLWYFDIGISPDQAYFPFLRLALTRFQPESIGNLNMSRVVTTEFVQLTADRSASVVALGSNNYAVSVSGVTATNIPPASQLGVPPPPTNAALWTSGHTVTAELQQASTPSPDPLDWTTITAPVMLTPAQLSGYSVIYQGNVALPAGLPSGTTHRILFREYEIYAADNEDGVRTGIGVVEVGVGSTSYRTRLVYTDAIGISG